MTAVLGEEEEEVLKIRWKGLLVLKYEGRAQPQPSSTETMSLGQVKIVVMVLWDLWNRGHILENS